MFSILLLHLRLMSPIMVNVSITFAHERTMQSTTTSNPFRLTCLLSDTQLCKMIESLLTNWWSFLFEWMVDLYFSGVHLLIQSHLCVLGTSVQLDQVKLFDSLDKGWNLISSGFYIKSYELLSSWTEQFTFSSDLQDLPISLFF